MGCGCDGGKTGRKLPASATQVLLTPDQTWVEQARETFVAAMKPGCDCAASEAGSCGGNAAALNEVRGALERLLQLGQLGSHLAFAPWLVDIFAPDYAVVRRWIEDTQSPNPPCGTDIRASMPFDPTRIPWWRWYTAAWTGRRPSAVAGQLGRRTRRAAPPVDTAARVHGPPPEDDPDSVVVDDGTGGSRGTPRPSHPFPGHPDRTFPIPSAERGDLSCDAFLRKFSIPGPTFNPNVGIEETAVPPAAPTVSVVDSPGLRVTAALDDHFNRPILRLLCTYLEGYYGRLEKLAETTLYTSPAFLLRAAEVSGVFPWDPGPSNDGPFARSNSIGYPSAAGGPAPQSGVPFLEFPDHPDILDRTGAGSRWLRINQNIFVLSRDTVGAGGAGHNGAVDANSGLTSAAVGGGAAESDTLGLAIRLIQRCLPQLRFWQEPVTAAFGAAFDWNIAGVNGGNMLDAMEAWYSPFSPFTLQILVRDDAIFNTGAGGFGFWPGATVVLARTLTTTSTSTPPVISTSASELTMAVDALAALRAQAALQFVSLGGGIDEPAFIDEAVVKEAAEQLANLSQLLLHESGHLLGPAQFDVDLGISGDWYDGPQLRDMDALGTYTSNPGPGGFLASAPTILSSLNAQTLAANALVGLTAALAPGLLGLIPFLGGVEFSGPFVISNHYVLTLYQVWFETLLRQQRGPLNGFQNNACLCSDDVNDVNVLQWPLSVPGPLRASPLHWGWALAWPLGARPCDEVPLPEVGSSLPNDWNCWCNPLNCRCTESVPMIAAVGTRPWC